MTVRGGVRLEVEVAEGRLVVVDGEKNEVVIGTDGWSPTATAPRLERRVDGTATGETGGLAFPAAAVTIDRAGDARWTTFEEAEAPVELDHGTYLVQVEANVGVYVAFTAAARLSRSGLHGPVRLAFDRPTPVTLGFRSRTTRPRDVITVPRSLEGAASALRYLSSTIQTDTADKSYASLRLHPPAVDFGTHLDVPEGVYREAAFSDVTVAVPRDLATLFTVAPLVYYLQADVALRKGNATATVESPTLDEPVTLGDGDRLAAAVADLMHRVFYLDCLVRNAGPWPAELAEQPLAGELGMSVEQLYRASTAERLRTYLALDYDRVRDRLPQWHLETVVAPTLENVRALPYLLERLSLIQPPRPVPVDRRILVPESVAEAYDSPARGWSSPPSVDLVRNETRYGRVQGWLAPGTPIDAFRATLPAFEHRFDYHASSDGTRRVLVIINDEGMLAERDAVEAVYLERAEELSIEVEVEASLTREQFADRLQSPVDFLHYIGHCEENGLRCEDGLISGSQIDETLVRTFFLNACGSFDEGLALVEKGSVAGAVTIRNVLNHEATLVGTEFARLVMYGFDINEALDIASRRSLLSKFYSVVGDGTYTLSQNDSVIPAAVQISDLEDDLFRIIIRYIATNAPGGVSSPTLSYETRYHLTGNLYSVELSKEELSDYLEYNTIPLLMDNNYVWSEELTSVL